MWLSYLIRTGEVVVDDHVDTLDVDTTAEEVRGHQQTLLPVLELVVLLDSVHMTRGGL